MRQNAQPVAFQVSRSFYGLFKIKTWDAPKGFWKSSIGRARLPLSITLPSISWHRGIINTFLYKCIYFFFHVSQWSEWCTNNSTRNHFKCNTRTVRELSPYCSPAVNLVAVSTNKVHQWIISGLDIHRKTKAHSEAFKNTLRNECTNANYSEKYICRVFAGQAVIFLCSRWVCRDMFRVFFLC